MSVLLQISDTHFGTEQPSVVAALLQLTRALQPDVVVVSGDITQRARSRQFRAAADFLAQVDVPARIVLPGNHDIPLFDLVTRIAAPYRLFRRYCSDNLEPHFASNELLVIGVNSTRAARHKNGVIDATQIARVAAQLQTATSRQLRVVALHHPVLAISPHDRANLAHGSDTAVREWAAAGADLILGGHIHLPYARALHEHFPLARAVWVAQAGTAVSRRTRQGVPNSVNVVRTQHDQSPQALLERWDYAEAQREFTLVESTPMQCAR